MELKKVPEDSDAYLEVSNAIFFCNFSGDGEYQDWFVIEPQGSTPPIADPIFLDTD